MGSKTKSAKKDVKSKTDSKISKITKKEAKSQSKKNTEKVTKTAEESNNLEEKLFGSVLKNEKNIDSKIGSLFGSSGGAGPLARRVIGSYTPVPRPKSEENPEENPEEGSEEASEEASNDSESESEDVSAKVTKKRKRKNEDNEDLEAEYMERLADKEEGDEEEEKSEEENSKEEDKKDKKSKNEATAVNLKESELEKADRTLFVGNLNSVVMTSKKEEKALKKKFQGFGQIESIRFRSIAFSEQLPKKVAYIQKKFHDFKDTVNAYIVFKSKDSINKALKLNGEVFLDHHLRIDSVSHPFKKDNNRSVFIGNLDFNEREESLWKFFESCGKIEYVRVVRDPKTNLGKGFAYVQFEEPVSVSKALLLNGKELITKTQQTQEGKPKKPRKLRVTRCKKSASEKQALSDIRAQNKVHLNEKQKTKIGRAKTILGKQDRAEAGKAIIEGARAQEGKGVSVKNGKIKKPRVKKARHTERSKKFRKLREEFDAKNKTAGEK